MSAQASVEIRKLVYRHMLPKLIHHFHCVPDKKRPILNSSRYAERGVDMFAKRKKLEQKLNEDIQAYCIQNSFFPAKLGLENLVEFMSAYNRTPTTFQARPLLRRQFLPLENEFKPPSDS